MVELRITALTSLLHFIVALLQCYYDYFIESEMINLYKSVGLVCSLKLILCFITMLVGFVAFVNTKWPYPP